MRILTKCVVLIGVLMVSQALATRISVSGFITTNTTWSADTVALTGNVGVNRGVLTIMPGTVVMPSAPRVLYVLSDSAAGAIHAVGTPDHMIKFNSLSKITFSALIYDSLTIFQYCNLTGMTPGFEFRNPDNNPNEASCPLIDHCIVSGSGYTNIYVTSGASPTISNCYLYNATEGIFVHGCGNKMKVLNCAISRMGNGIINGSAPPWDTNPGHNLTVDHVTIYNCDGVRKQSGVGASNGNGITCVNAPGILTVTNCILDSIANYGIMDNNYTDPNFPGQTWTVNQDYNCFYRCTVGATRDFSPGSHSVQANPQMLNPVQQDFTYPSSSPCWGKGTNGSNIGFQPTGWSAIDDLFRKDMQGRGLPPVKISANPFVGTTSFLVGQLGLVNIKIFNQAGCPVWSYQATWPQHEIVWNGQDANGQKAPAGIYCVVLESGKQTSQQKIVKLQ